MASAVSVLDFFNAEPRNIVETNASEPIMLAKARVSSSTGSGGTNNPVGCGSLAIYSLLEYLGDYAWLNALTLNKNDLAASILKNTRTYQSNGNALTRPIDMAFSISNTLKDFDYHNLYKPNLYEDLNANINDTYNTFMNSIDNGLPIIYYAHFGNNYLNNHYTVIYAYEMWANEDNPNISYPVFKARYNLTDSSEPEYIYPSSFNYESGAIVLDKYRSLLRISDTDITSNEVYPFYETLLNGQNNVIGSYLRTGYIGDVNNNKYLVMSPRRENAGTAFLHLRLPFLTSDFYMSLGLWSSTEYLDNQNDSFYVEYMDKGNNYVINNSIDIGGLSTNRDSLNYFHFKLDVPTYDIRLIARSSSIGSKNKGRFVLHSLMSVSSQDNDKTELSFISKYAIHNKVQVSKNVHVSAADKSFVESIYPSINWNVSEATSNHPSYYTYTATPSGFDELIIQKLYNDLDSLILVINGMEKIYNDYEFPISFNHSCINSILAYIREISTIYFNRDWSIIAGSADQLVFTLINSDYSSGMHYRDYFYSFLTSTYRNTVLNGNTSESFIDRTLDFIDPFDSFKTIDLIHLFASIDGVYSDTGVGIAFLSATSNWQRDLASWAGDLQSALGSTVDKTNEIMETLHNFWTFEDAFFGINTAASEQDMLADFDATNIAKMYLDDGNNSLSSAVANYYLDCSYDNTQRYSNFIWSATRDNHYISGGDYAVFEEKVYCLLGAERGDPNTDFTDDVIPLVIIDFNYDFRYKLLHYDNGCYPPLLTRRAVAQAFIDYIYRRAQA